MDIWTQLLSNAPTVGYKEDVYDCEDIAMEFKAYVAKFQATSPVWQNFNAPFSVGLAVGQFSWVDNGQSLHAANFVVLEPRNGEVPTFLWLDLRLRRTFPFGEMRRGLVWVIL